MPQPATLVLEDGTVFRGDSFGATGETTGEVVFHTGMSGYTEILTDPSYAGQMVCMTYPLIGNYGVNREDFESARAHLRGFIVKENSRVASNHRAEQSLGDFLAEQGVLGIEGIDTRRLVKHIREAGAMKGVLSTETDDVDALRERAAASEGLVGRDLASEVTTAESYEWTEPFPGLEPKEMPYRVVAFDYGVKYNILRLLASHGCRVTVVPASATAEEVKALSPDGVFLSNGPGDPGALRRMFRQVEGLLGSVPIFGICLGHQILGWVYGGTTYKLKFGHHGGNQPVQRLDTGAVEISSQNHGFAVDVDSLRDAPVVPTHVNLNDRTNEGLAHRDVAAFSVQYHPESAPGPHDSRYLFRRFTDMIETGRPLDFTPAG
jgi:carbamoyl-phosphate synthase small subunit